MVNKELENELVLECQRSKWFDPVRQNCKSPEQFAAEGIDLTVRLFTQALVCQNRLTDDQIEQVRRMVHQNITATLRGASVPPWPGHD